MVFAEFVALPARTSTHECVSIILGVLTSAPLPIDLNLFFVVHILPVSSCIYYGYIMLRINSLGS
jgi:hypothetical protein